MKTIMLSKSPICNQRQCNNFGYNVLKQDVRIVRRESRINNNLRVSAAIQVPVIDQDEEVHVESPMWCYQCEQTIKGVGCTEIGVCGKEPEIAALQDLLIYACKGLACWAHHAHQSANIVDEEVNSFLKAAVFCTLTNVNLEALKFEHYVYQSHNLCNKLISKLRSAGIKDSPVMPQLPQFDSVAHPADWVAGFDRRHEITPQQMQEYGPRVGMQHRHELMDGTILGLQELIVYGLKGACAYAHHAEMLGSVRSEQIDIRFNELLTFLCSEQSVDANALLGKALEVGEVNLAVMQMLDEAHTTRFGHPEPTQVSLVPKEGPAILVSGHDILDLQMVLEQTKNTGINVYTHGELLPAHGYPEIKKYTHLAGHYGGAWYKQKKEFREFPGAVLVTTNCILIPDDTYRDRIFTTGEVGLPTLTHLGNKDFTPLINKALQLPAFTKQSIVEHEVIGNKEVMVGFGHKAILGVADKVVDAAKGGQLKHIFLVGGCDGKEGERRYYTDLVDKIPKDCLVLTLGCGKFRFFNHDLGMLEDTGLPRLLDMGQCNDAYGALVVAQELAKALNTTVNKLPLSLDISWFEQKAVAILLTLLYLDVKNIRLGPKLPAFLTPQAIQILVDKYNIQLADTKNVDMDLQKMLA
eukprot:TRINITY_DN7532_c0_g1_i14.p1 TRINITY_DN7532_c0_g1~~TRINITY_DN7532_c0_g1_i14.p1  ORF type:complete len:638 (-),score=115.82 TRINITY_DN7532_c0_g1_i14:1053-2966(-)